MKCRVFLIIDDVAIDHVDVTFNAQRETESDVKAKAVEAFKKKPRHKMWTITPEKVEVGQWGNS